MGSGSTSTVHWGVGWAILLVLFLMAPLPGQNSPDDRSVDSLDPALRSIVDLVIRQPQVDEVVDRAWQWARNRQRTLDLLTAILAEARQRKDDLLFRRCAEAALDEGDPYRAIQILEEGSSVPESKECPHALARLWLRGGWLEAAQSIRDQNGVDPLTEFVLRVKSGESTLSEGHSRLTLPPLTEKDREFLIAVFPRLGLSRQGKNILEQEGDLSAAFRILLRAGDLEGIEVLLARNPELSNLPSDGEKLAYARLRGEPLDDQVPSPLLKSMWMASMGFIPQSPSMISISRSPLRLSQFLDSLGNACTHQDINLARKLWVSIELLTDPLTPLPALNPRWRQFLGSAIPEWMMPRQTANRIGDVTDPAAAQLCRRSNLYSEPGSRTEARLWFHAGRLSDSIHEIERALRIGPMIRYRWPALSPGVSVQSSLAAAALPIPDPLLFKFESPRDSVIGELSGKHLRIPVANRSDEIWYLEEWQVSEEESRSTGNGISLQPAHAIEMPLRIQLTDAQQSQMQILGTHQRWSIQVTGRDEWTIQVVDGESLFDQQGLPRIDLLNKIIDPCPESVQTDVKWDQLPSAVRSFAAACAQYLRSPQWNDQSEVVVVADQMTVTIGPITGLFRTDPPLRNDSPEMAAALQQFPLVKPDHAPPVASRLHQPSQFSGSAILERTWERDRPAPISLSGNAFSLPSILPPGEKLLSVTGTDERLIITRSGKVGWIPAGSIATARWLPLLKTPLEGPNGIAPLPEDEHPSRGHWADSATPRVRETWCPEGSVFLIVSDSLLRVDSRGATPVASPDNFPGHCASAQLLTVEGKVPDSIHESLFPWYIDSSGEFLHGPSFRQPLPAKGAYSLWGHPLGPLVLGQDRGETWLAQWRESKWQLFKLPSLPGERDRPQLRAAAMSVVGSQILLLADRLWALTPDQPPRALTPASAPGAYRAVRWVQPPPLIRGDLVWIQRPWRIDEVWRFTDE